MTKLEKKLLKVKIERLAKLYSEIRREESQLNRLLDISNIDKDNDNFTIISGYLQDGYSKPLIDYIEECISEKL